MAIQFRIRFLFILVLLTLNGSILSAAKSVNANIPTPLKITSQNPSYIIASNVKSTPIYLDCTVSLNITKELVTDFISSTLYNFGVTNEQNDDDDDDDNIEHNEAEVRRQYQEKFHKYNRNTNNHNNSNKVNKNVSKIAKNRIQVNDRSNNYHVDDDDYEKNSAETVIEIRRHKRKAIHDILSYEWLKNDNSFMSINNSNEIASRDDYTLFPNGTIKFMSNDHTTGVYKCKVKYTYVASKRFEIGPAFSLSTKVEFASFTNEESGKKLLSINEGESAVLPCPIKSIPEANFTWSLNSINIAFDIGMKNIDRRHYFLKNGSLLIVNIQTADAGVYRCDAFNGFVKKNTRNSLVNLAVVPRTDNNNSNDDDQRTTKADVLLPKLQNSILKIKSGEKLILHCAGRNTRNISWTFIPRNANSSHTIKLPEFVNELRYVNVSERKHDGIYNCSTDNDFQTFDVTILTPPVIISNQASKESSIPIWTVINCTVSGNPMPTIEWYRNGELMINNPIRYAKSSLLKIETIDPHDEGLYQCLARNDYGEASGTFYLHLRPSFLLNSAPYDLKCSSMDNNKIMVNFKKDESEKITRIQYYVATDELNDISTEFSPDLVGKNSFNISKKYLKNVKSLKPFYLYVRSMMPSGNSLTLSPLSKQFTCAFQEIQPKFVKAQNGTFLRWTIDDLTSEELSQAIITIQFLKNGTSDALSFASEVVGTTVTFGDYVMWSDIEKNLQKIAVNSSDHGEWTEIQVAGNVTGILIIKVEEIFVRIFGSIEHDGGHLQQDFGNLEWKSVKSSFAPLHIESVEARSLTIGWNGIGKTKCMRACTVLKQNSIVALREPKVKLNCELINDPSAKSFYIRHLQPTSNYDVYIKDCNENFLTTEVNFQTLRDVPGPVTDSYFERKNGIILNWSPPKNPNGIIHNYLVEWTLNSITHNATVTEQKFRFPNTKDTDKFNISVRANGEGGIGHPLIIDPSRSSMLPVDIYGQSTPHSAPFAIEPVLVLMVLLISVLLLMFVLSYAICQKHRYCKNGNGIINNEQSSFSPTTSPGMNPMRSDEMYEMQTLISPPTQNSIMPNGKDNLVKSSDNPSNGDIISNENKKVLRTSTPTEEMKTIEVLCDEPPIKCDIESQIKMDERKPNGFLKTFQSITPTKKIGITPEKSIMKVNGNSSPYKCLQSSVNDQNTSSASSSYGSSHRQLIDISSLCNGSNNNNNNNSHHHNDRSKIGKSSSIETDNDDEDSEENMHEFDLNDSNISTKPLHPISGWNFRQHPNRSTAIVGPNG